jgi:hypothetical protein
MKTESQNVAAILRERLRRQDQSKRKPRNPFATSWNHITTPLVLEPDPDISGAKNNTIRFAFVSSPPPTNDDFETTRIPLCFDCKHNYTPAQCHLALTSPNSEDRLSCQKGLDTASCDRHLVKEGGFGPASKWDNYTHALAEALDKYRANVVCFNELGAPINPEGPSIRFFNHVRKLSKQWKALVVAGSFHDFRTKYNTGYLFTPNCPEEGWSFHKQTSAVELGERVSVPPFRRSVVIPAFGVRIGVVICLDIVDYSTVASLVSLADLIDFVLVPACSFETQALERAARIASQGMPGGVGIINFDRGRKYSSSLYVFGEEIDPVESARLGGNSGWIDIYEITWDEFRNRKLSQDTPSDVNWLFRSRPIDRA